MDEAEDPRAKTKRRPLEKACIGIPETYADYGHGDLCLSSILNNRSPPQPSILGVQ